MTLILSGTDGLSDIDGSAATPAIRGTDTNTGIFFPAADTIAFSEGGTEAMRIDSSGNLLVGTTTTGSPGISLTNNYNIGWTQSAGESIPNIFRQTSSAATVVANGYRYSGTANGFASSFSSSYAKCAISCGTAAGAITFYTDAAAAVAAGTDVTPTERARITNDGNFCFGTTSTTVNPGVSVLPTGRINIGRSNDDAVAEFYRSGTRVGQINVTTTATSYVTSSDYRLKENIAPMTGALATVAALNPCTYTWKADGSAGQGFIAHELAEVVPDCVTGEKDAVETYTDEEGNEQTRPVYQGIDTSFLVATLTAAIQEQQALIQSLTARIEALEGK